MGYAMMRYVDSVKNASNISIFEQEIEVNFNSVKDFFTAETMDEIHLPEDLESGKAVEQIFMALQDALCKMFKLPKEEYVFFLDPYNSYYVSGIWREYLPPEVAANPLQWWPSHTANEWKKVY